MSEPDTPPVTARVAALRAWVGPQSWRRLRAAWAFGVFAALVEAVSLGAILPVISLLLNRDGGVSVAGMVVPPVALGAGLMLLYAAGLGLRALALRRMVLVHHQVGYRSAAKAFGRVLTQSMDWHAAHHSGETQAVLLGHVQDVVERALMPLGRMISQAVLILAILALMIALVPVLSLTLFGMLAGAYGAFFVFLRPVIRRGAQDAVSLHRLRHRLATEALGAIKEIRLAHLEDRYDQRFATASEGIAALTSKKTVMSEMPRLVLEAFVFMGLIAVGAVWAANGTPGDRDFVPTLLLAATAGLKLFPLVSQIYAQAATITSGLPALDHILIFEASLEPARDDVAAPVLTRTVELRGVTFRHPGADAALFRDLDLTVSVGESLAILGPSGAGKSTLIDIIAGLRAPQGGAVVIDGRALAADQMRSWQEQLRYCPQMPTLFDLSVRENICGTAPGDPEHYREALRTVGLSVETAWVNSAQPVGERGARLSGGQIRRVGLARAFHDRARLYILDEPTSGLDPEAAEALIDPLLARTRTAALIVVTHDPRLAARCDRQIRLGHRDRP